MKLRRLLLCCALAALARAHEVARTPPMGWNSWELFRLNINERLIRSMADAMVRSGMRDAGYQYIVIDAGWKSQRRANDGRLAADPAKFPSGMKALAEYVHGEGLKLGLYTDAGTLDCAGTGPGSLGHEELDARAFAAWGVDYVKEDWCNSTGLDARAVYTKMSRALRATGRPIVFSLCEWGDNKPWTWARGIGDLWRTTGDDTPCWDCGRDKMNWKGGYPRGWTLILDAQIPLVNYAGPGHWNDPDMLEVGQHGMSLAESRAQVSLWAILAAPLLATNDLRSMPTDVASILINRDVIAVDQDAAGIEGTRVKKSGGQEVWSRRLQDGSLAVVLFNRRSASARIGVTWRELGLRPDASLPVCDLWNHRDAGHFEGAYEESVPTHGAVMIKIGRARESAEVR